jgi:hypothetical protein
MFLRHLTDVYSPDFQNWIDPGILDSGILDPESVHSYDGFRTRNLKENGLRPRGDIDFPARLLDWKEGVADRLMFPRSPLGQDISTLR